MNKVNLFSPTIQRFNHISSHIKYTLLPPSIGSKSGECDILYKQCGKKGEEEKEEEICTEVYRILHMGVLKGICFTSRSNQPEIDAH